MMTLAKGLIAKTIMVAAGTTPVTPGIQRGVFKRIFQPTEKLTPTEMFAPTEKLELTAVPSSVGT
jgi:hypothetical protein